MQPLAAGVQNGDISVDVQVVRRGFLGECQKIQQLVPKMRFRTNEFMLDRTGLMISAQQAHIQIVRFLAPLEIRMQDANGDTALMLACGSKSPCAELLLAEVGMTNK